MAGGCLRPGCNPHENGSFLTRPHCLIFHLGLLRPDSLPSSHGRGWALPLSPRLLTPSLIPFPGPAGFWDSLTSAPPEAVTPQNLYQCSASPLRSTSGLVRGLYLSPRCPILDLGMQAARPHPPQWTANLYSLGRPCPDCHQLQLGNLPSPHGPPPLLCNRGRVIGVMFSCHCYFPGDVNCHSNVQQRC